MISSLKPYPRMKGSGVPWLGDVPEHWESGPGKLCYREKKVPNTGLKETNILSLSHGQIVSKPADKLHGLVPASFETYQIIEGGDIIVRPTDLQNDRTSLRFGLSRNNGIITSAYLCLRTNKKMEYGYGYLLLHVYDLKKIFYGLGSGLRQNLDFKDFKYLPCLLPSLPEQAAIVRFIDYYDRKIRRYILAKQKMIKLLEEQKQAIIHRAVTGHLDVRTGKPYPAYKPSNVEWLGGIPEHWEVRRVRNIIDMRVSNVDKHTKDSERPVRLCNYVDVYKNDRIRDSMLFMDASAADEEIERFRLAPGDVLITKDSETWNDIGVPAFVESSSPDLVCGYHLAILRPFPNQMHGSFLFRVLQSINVAVQFHVEANGVTRFGLSHAAIKSVCLPIPSLPEQVAIVEYLDRTISNIDTAINRTNREISLLREYRTRLISDVVTGKLDVREAAARLPDDIEEPEPLETADELIDADDPTENEDLAEALPEEVEA